MIDGRFDGQAFRLPVRIYYEDTDAGGIVYHANYLRYCERARTEMLRALGVDQRVLLDSDGLGFAVMSAAVDYRRPAVLDDALDVTAELVELKRVSMRAYQRVERDGVLLAEVRLRVACVNGLGRPIAMPDWAFERLQPALSPQPKADR